jgi:ABC-type methionine transport system ATPase subunit
VDLSVPPGGVVVFGGRSGSGKSALLEICVGLHKPSSGAVLWDGDDITGLSRYELYARRKSVGYVFQSHALIANHTVFDNIALPLRCGTDLGGEAIGKRVRALMEELEISRGVEKRFPEALSAAQLKCAAVARALVNGPSLLMLDEPLSGVDPATANIIVGALHRKWKAGGMSVVMSAHSLSAWPEWSAGRFMLKSGRLDSADEAFAKVRSLRHNQRYGHGQQE